MANTENRLRLKSIKLVGFKSFVDPTTVPFPSDMVAIVGPNGCGKSNIIDAVRWVMGESSAKNLRGESMSDVIFNGSQNRKPLGQASIELLFDNPNGAIGGQYASYSEIAIKRLVTRDGQSNYYLNNVKCRRRDIIDIFLGTGLGPRSYAIIGQGTVSRLIEAKPDELRVYLEEAAGISKYKERRRETENRIRHTRDNLDRLNDIREELDKQLRHLQRQANAAEKYTELKQQERSLKGELYALRWKNIDNKLKNFEQDIRELEVAQEEQVSLVRKADTQIEILREQHIEQQDNFNEEQAHFYSVGAEVSRLEQQIQHQQERAEQAQEELIQTKQSLSQAEQENQQDCERITRLQAQLADIEPQYEELAGLNEQYQEQFQTAEQNMQDWQARWESYNSAAASAQQQAEVEQTHIRHLESSLNQSKHRITKLEEELEKLEDNDSELEISKAEEEYTLYHDQLEQQQTNIETQAQALSTQREANTQLQQQLQAQRLESQSLQGKLASLETLQQAALGQQAGEINTWLEQKSLDKQARLAQQVSVNEGWEVAVETVLGQYLQAVCIDDISQIADYIGSQASQLPKGQLCFIDNTHNNIQANNTQINNPQFTSLLSQIKSDHGLGHLLANIYTAENLLDALAMRSSLGTNESVVTKDGIWLGANWLRVAKDEDAKAGIIAREKEINYLSTKLESAKQAICELEAKLEAGKDNLTELEQARDEAQHAFADLSEQCAQAKAQLQIKRNRAEQRRQRRTQLSQDLEQQQSSQEETDEKLKHARQTWQEAMEILETQVDKREALLSEKETCRQQFEQTKQQAQASQQQLHVITTQLQVNQTELETKLQHQGRMQAQINNYQARAEQLAGQYEQAISPIESLKAQLEEGLTRKLNAESALAQAREKVSEIEHRLREQEHLRHEAEQALEKAREKLQTQRMSWQELEVRRKTIQEQLQESGQELQVILSTLSPDADEQTWEQQLTQVQNRIQRLGAINLAAIDEYKSQSERKVYLDTQHEDLIEALTTLEEAINKIDRETRQRFKETFDTVNNKFQQLFPKIFGGGSASLEMTGEDLLDTGISVMARPPGKRNSTIHLLSGGEKALTAIALVFAIFQLNPAPFCMLDEVDAPLDDANVMRFSNLVKEMSSEVQFIYISHNKGTIEMADHLAGVTMREPGVSRMVSVDIEEAISLAEA